MYEITWVGKNIVTRMEYSELRKLVTSAKSRWNILRVKCGHPEATANVESTNGKISTIKVRLAQPLIEGARE